MTSIAESVRARIDEIYRTDSRRVLATLIRLLGDFDLAEEALHDAFTAALERWPNEGLPGNPRAWLVSTGRFKAIDRVRRRATFDTAVSHLVLEDEQRLAFDAEIDDGDGVADAPRGAVGPCIGHCPDHRGPIARDRQA